MTKEWKLIASFAAVGFLITVLIVLYAGFSASFDEALLTPVLIFCPACLLTLPFGNIMDSKIGSHLVWFLIAFANSGLYALIGATIAGLRKTE